MAKIKIAKTANRAQIQNQAQHAFKNLLPKNATQGIIIFPVISPLNRKRTPLELFPASSCSSYRSSVHVSVVHINRFRFYILLRRFRAHLPTSVCCRRPFGLWLRREHLLAVRSPPACSSPIPPPSNAFYIGALL